MTRKPQRRTLAVLALGALLAGGLGGAAAVMSPVQGKAAAPDADRPAQPVRVSPVTFSAPENVRTYTGTIRPRHEAALAFRVAGKIVSRPAEVGTRVAKGQVLALLDDTDARLQAELAAAEDAAARVDRRRAADELARSRRLFDEGHLSRAAFDRARSAAAEADARAERAARSLALAGNALSYTRLVADADGIVTATPAEVGQVVAAGTPVVTVARAGAVDVVFTVPETDRDRLSSGRAQATVWGEEGLTRDLTLRDIAPDADPSGRTYRVRMAMAAPDAAFGRTVTVALQAAAAAPVATVPLAAVLEDGTGPAVWRVRADRAERVPVELAAVTGAVAAIRGPLAEGDLIVSLGAHKVDPARPLRVVETVPEAGE
jgi:RND family efflux transporter MFP subunit